MGQIGLKNAFRMGSSLKIHQIGKISTPPVNTTSAQLVSVQKRHYGGVPLKEHLRTVSANEKNTYIHRVRQLIREVSPNRKYIGPLHHTLHESSKKFFDDIINCEYMMPSKGEYGDVSIRGHAGKLEESTPHSFEFYVAVEQCPANFGNEFAGGYMKGVCIPGDDGVPIPIILTSYNDANGTRREVRNQTSAISLEKKHFHEDFADLKVEIESIMSGGLSE